jgi:3-oxoacyl-[acyl-carrier protein] reductase
MSRKKFGRIINISSVVGSTGNPYQSVYGMTKGAIDNLTKTLAGELAPFGILVNSVAPGFIDTAMTRKLPEGAKQAFLDRIPMKRLGTPDEVADVVEFLATRAAYVTGTVIHVNGGMYAG